MRVGLYARRGLLSCFAVLAASAACESGTPQKNTAANGGASTQADARVAQEDALPGADAGASDPRCWVTPEAPANPFTLSGKLAVTYYDESIPETAGDGQEIGVFDLASRASGATRLTNNLVNESELDISADGTKLLYTVRPKLDVFDEGTEIWRMNIDGSNPTRLLEGRPMGGPVWLPGEKGFLYTRWGGQPDVLELMKFDLAAKTSTTGAGGAQGTGDPEVSHDGTLVAFKKALESDRDFQPSIYVMNADGTNERRLTKGFSDHDPVFSKDNKKVFFERYYGPGDWFDASQNRTKPEHNFWGIVEVDIASGEERVLVPHDPCGRHLFWLPTVSPDGAHIMIVHNDVMADEEDTPWSDLWAMKIDGSELQKVEGTDGFYFFDWGK